MEMLVLRVKLAMALLPMRVVAIAEVMALAVMVRALMVVSAAELAMDMFRVM